MNTQYSNNLAALDRELAWLQEVIAQVIRSYLKQEGHETSWLDISPPDISECDSVYATQMRDWNCNTHERLTLALCMAPHLKPEILDIFFGINALYDRRFTEFGGITPSAFSGFLPTGQTLAFLISANNPELRLEVMNILSPQHIFASENVIALKRCEPEFLPSISGVLALEEDWLQYFIVGERRGGTFSRL